MRAGELGFDPAAPRRDLKLAAGHETKKKLLPFGLSLRAVVLGAVVVVACFSGTLWALNTFFPRNPLDESRPALTSLSRCNR